MAQFNSATLRLLQFRGFSDWRLNVPRFIFFFRRPLPFSLSNAPANSANCSLAVTRPPRFLSSAAFCAWQSADPRAVRGVRPRGGSESRAGGWQATKSRSHQSPHRQKQVNAHTHALTLTHTRTNSHHWLDFLLPGKHFFFAAAASWAETTI